MARSSIVLPPDSTGKKERSYEYGSEGHLPFVVPNSPRSIGGRFNAATFAISMVANAATQNLATIANATGSGVLVAIQSLAVLTLRTSTTAYINVSPIRLWSPQTTVPSGGTALTKHKLDATSSESALEVSVLGASSADNTASAITYALPADNPFAGSVFPQTLTGAGQFLTDPARAVLLGSDDAPLVLRAGESCLVTIQNNANTSSSILAVEFGWEEFTAA